MRPAGDARTGERGVMDTRLRCDRSGKVQYASPKAAKKAVRGLQVKGKSGGRMHSYHCPDCRWWHIGHSVSTGRA